MLAVGMVREQPGVRSFDIPMPAINDPDDVLIRVKEVGLDGTDFNIVRFGLPEFAEGRNELVLGHEGVGVVEAVGSAVSSLVPGDTVVITVRRGCGQCAPCKHNQSDMCMTGLFTERGIHQIDGLLTSYIVDKEQYVVKVQPSAAKVAVFSEPFSIAEKGVEQIKIIQSRLPWFCGHPGHTYLSPHWGGCKVALVVGAGPLGLLSAALIRLSGATVYVTDVVPASHPKARLVRAIDATYIDSRARSPQQIVEFCCTPTGELDIIFEASGAADTALALIPYMSRSSIYVMTGIPRGDVEVRLEGAQLVRQVVRFNQVIVGSVNSNRRHFEAALRDIERVDTKFKGMLASMITARFSLDEYEKAFSADDPKRIKTVIQVEPWD